MTDKRMTEEDVVGELRDGMTIGIGGWGSRRKPMSIVRAILRSDLNDLTVVSYGGPDVGMLCAAGKVRKVVYGFVSLDSIPLEPHFRARPPERHDRGDGARRGHAPVGPAGRRDAGVVPSVPGRSRLRRSWTTTRASAPSRRPTTTARSCVAMPALPLDVALLHANRADARRQRPVPGHRLVLRRPLLHGRASARFVSCERIVATERLPRGGPAVSRSAINRIMTDGVIEAPHGAHFTHCVPDYERDEAFQTEYAATAKDPRGVGRRSGPSTSTSPKPTTSRVIGVAS